MHHGVVADHGAQLHQPLSSCNLVLEDIHQWTKLGFHVFDDDLYLFIDNIVVPWGFDLRWEAHKHCKIRLGRFASVWF